MERFSTEATIRTFHPQPFLRSPLIGQRSQHNYREPQSPNDAGRGPQTNHKHQFNLTCGRCFRSDLSSTLRTCAGGGLKCFASSYISSLDLLQSLTQLGSTFMGVKIAFTSVPARMQQSGSIAYSVGGD